MIHKLDLVVANSGDNTVSVLLGNGNGTFQTQMNYTVGNSPQSVTSGDFNNDTQTGSGSGQLRRQHRQCAYLEMEMERFRLK